MNDYNLPHDTLRPHQVESIEWCLTRDGFGIVEAPTGSGKTAYAAATASRKSVIALCRTKNLQAENYGSGYGFDVLYGKANYSCVHPDVVGGATCADCLFDGKMNKCPVAHQCEYLVQKELCKASTRVSLNYAYYLSAQWPKLSPPSVLFLDEAHELHEIVTQWAGCTITEKDRRDWGLDKFPELKPANDGGMLIKLDDPLPVALSWLEDARLVLRRHYTRLAKKTDRAGLKQKHRCERLGRKITATIDALRSCSDEWYIKSGLKAQKFRREYRPAFICKPLTARHHFRNYFLNGPTTIAMSATVGKLEPFTKELGISEYDSLIVPNQYDAGSRPVYTLDVMSMGRRARDADFEHQARVIAESILACPPDWSGLVLVTRKTEAHLLAERLARRGLQDRVWVTPGYDRDYVPTNEQVDEWNCRKTRMPNSICITWSFWVGYDGLDERICIAAKVPYPVWGSGDSYEAAWRAYSMDRYNLQTAVTLAQGLGRTRRGRPQDYDVNGDFNGFVAIADGSWNRIKSHLPSDVKDSIID